MKAWQYIVFWTLGLGLWLVLLASSNLAYKEVLIDHHTISFENRLERSFLDLSEMEKTLKLGLQDSNLLLSEINKALLEESIDNHPAIRKAEVYSNIDGSLRIMLWQHNPIARVMHQTSSFYLLEDGTKMPLSPHYSEAVPIVYGDLNSEQLKDIAGFWQGIRNDEFFQEFFAGLSCNKSDEWILYPVKGDFEIVIGKPTELELKLAKLKAFYTRAPKLENINKLGQIDLRFEGQVICRKN